MKWLLTFIFLFYPALSYAGKCDYLLIFRMDKSFTKKQKDIVEKAVKVWHVASKNRICFYIIEADVSKPEDHNRDGITTIYSGNYKWQVRVANDYGCVYKVDKCLGITTPSSIVTQTHDIFIIRKNDKFLQLVTHEFGHVLGLQHSTNANDLMYEDVRKDVVKPSTRDVRLLKCLLNTKQLKNWNHVCK